MSRPLRTRAAARVAWALLGLVVAAALGVGAWRSSAAPTPAQRAAAIDASLRCPSCEGVSVLESSAPTAVAIRAVVAARVRAGWSEARVDQFLIDRYGPGILLRPPVHGATAWVWVLPPVAIAAALAGVLAVVVRRRPRSAGVSDDDRAVVARALARVPGRAEGGAW